MMNFNKAEFERAYGTSAQLPESDCAEIVFAGRSNVGKSSLLNRIFGRKGLARVSSVPGKTVTINFYDVDGIKFVDLPGYGYAKISASEKKRFAELMEGYFTSGRNIALAVQLIDMRRKPTADDYTMLSFFREYNIPYIIVLTKADKLNKTQFSERLAAAASETGDPSRPVIPFSALNSSGTDEIRKAISEYLQA